MNKDEKEDVDEHSGRNHSEDVVNTSSGNQENLIPKNIVKIQLPNKTRNPIQATSLGNIIH